MTFPGGRLSYSFLDQRSPGDFLDGPRLFFFLPIYMWEHASHDLSQTATFNVPSCSALLPPPPLTFTIGLWELLTA
jgi:hypothetical protein